MPVITGTGNYLSLHFLNSGCAVETLCSPSLLRILRSDIGEPNPLFPSSAGFHGEGRQEVRQAAEAAGAEYRGDLEHGCTTHLVCADGAGAAASLKLQCAAEWGIPALQWAWLKQSAARGRLLPTGLYLYSDAAPADAAAAPLPSEAAHAGNEAEESSAAADLAAAAEPARGAGREVAPQPQLQWPQHQDDGYHAAAARCGWNKHGALQQENVAPSLPGQPDTAQRSPTQSKGKAADILAARLGGLSVSRSSASHGFDAACGEASDGHEAAGSKAAASVAGSCTCSGVCSEEDDVVCTQPSPGGSRHTHEI